MPVSIPFCSDVFRWPEFKAFAKRLGIPLDKLIVELTVKMPGEDQLVTVDVRFHGEDNGDAITGS